MVVNEEKKVSINPTPFAIQDHEEELKFKGDSQQLGEESSEDELSPIEMLGKVEEVDNVPPLEESKSEDDK